MSSVIVVGLSGPSSSGKTTIALNLIKLFPRAVAIHQDDFYKSDSQVPTDVDTGFQDWDCPLAFDMNKMVQTIQSTRKQLEDLPGCGKSVEVHSSFASQWANPQKDVNSKLPPKALDSLRNTVLHRLNVESTEEIPFSLILVDGILLFYDEANNESPGAECDTGLFIYAQYETLKQRREARSAYVTKDGIWEDPPGYFDSIVWPNFVKYHSNLIAAHPEITDRKVTSAGGQKSAHEANVAICSSDMPFKDTLEVCVESILGEWNRRQQIQAQR